MECLFVITVDLIFEFSSSSKYLEEEEEEEEEKNGTEATIFCISPPPLSLSLSVCIEADSWRVYHHRARRKHSS